jgi:hypothetical protein
MVVDQGSIGLWFKEGIKMARVRSVCLAAAVAIALVGTAAHAGGEGLNPMSCSFKTGSAWSYTAGDYARSDPQPLAFDIAEVDFDAQTARLIVDGKIASAAMRVVRALNASHFIEVANEGYMNVTTVFDIDPAVGKRPAIHSRHLGVIGQPVFAQYAGFCTAK